MARRLRNVAFAVFICCAAMSQSVAAHLDGWQCGGVWSGCELNEGDSSDCYDCPIDHGLCQGFGGQVEYTECVEDFNGTWRQFCDCTPVP